jgi:retinol-binding protein 3
MRVKRWCGPAQSAQPDVEHRARSLRLVISVLALFLGSATAFGQVKIPNTRAGHTLQAFLDAFNSGDRAKLQAFLDAFNRGDRAKLQADIQTFDPKRDLDGFMAFQGQTGGYDLLSIDASDPLSIKFLVKEKANPTVTAGVMRLRDGAPPTVDALILRAIPPGAVFEDVSLDGQSRQRAIGGAIANLKRFYIFPDSAQKMADVLEAHLQSGDYDTITDGASFAGLLTDQLQAVSQDKHLSVLYNPFTQPAGQGDPSTAERGAQTARLRRTNCGFEKIEILSGNIGYLKFNGFADPAICGSTVTAAMNFIANVDAIIFDLRYNRGGFPMMVALISSYLFDRPTHLNDIYTRVDDFTTQFWTLPFVPGARLPDKPVFVLTSKNTFSAAEGFSYSLKNLKRATIVGETTGGGAHPVIPRSIDHFTIAVPFGRGINPISKTDWEGTGVEPDVPATASEALDVATKLAASKIPKN